MNAPLREADDGTKVRAIIARPWAAVPTHVLEDRRISLQARMVLSYMLDLARRPNWVIRLDNHVLPILGVSPDRWRSIRRELEAIGYYRRSETRGANGRISYEHLITDDPSAAGWAAKKNGSTALDFSEGGGTKGGGTNGGRTNSGGTKGGRAKVGKTGSGRTSGGAANDGRTIPGSSGTGQANPLHRDTSHSFNERRENHTSQEPSEQSAAGAAPNPQAQNAGASGPEATAHAAPDSRSAAQAPPTPPARTSEPRGTRVPADFQPDGAMLAWAALKRPDVDPVFETEKFTNYWKAIPGAKGRKLDWPATWNNWILGARATPGYAPALPAAAPPSKTLQSLENLDAFSIAYGHTDRAGPDQELQFAFPGSVDQPRGQ